MNKKCFCPHHVYTMMLHEKANILYVSVSPSEIRIQVAFPVKDRNTVDVTHPWVVGGFPIYCNVN